MENEEMVTNYSDPFNLNKLAQIELRFSFPIRREQGFNPRQRARKLFVTSIAFSGKAKKFSLN